MAEDPLDPRCPACGCRLRAHGAGSLDFELRRRSSSWCTDCGECSRYPGEKPKQLTVKQVDGAILAGFDEGQRRIRPEIRQLLLDLRNALYRADVLLEAAHVANEGAGELIARADDWLEPS